MPLDGAKALCGMPDRRENGAKLPILGVVERAGFEPAYACAGRFTVCRCYRTRKLLSRQSSSTLRACEAGAH
jgi:hypothetical protein